tara:strand:+ start:3700 stop:3933 length:234 start_codon:yes stop_codon:yes gene_type:complete
MALKSPQKSLKKWGKQKWRTKSGKPSSKTGERYLPDKVIKKLSSKEYSNTTRKKRKAGGTGSRAKYSKKIARLVRNA